MAPKDYIYLKFKFIMSGNVSTWQFRRRKYLEDPKICLSLSGSSSSYNVKQIEIRTS